MKKQIFTLIIFFVLISCKKEKSNYSTSQSIQKEVKATYISFGDTITAINSWSKEEMYNEFKILKKRDTIEVKFTSTISNICESNGCWIRLNLAEGKKSIIKFKNQSFFMPTNSKNREVIVKGKAYLNITTTDELREYAKKDGLSKEEIAEITEEEISFAIIADGVLMKE